MRGGEEGITRRQLLVGGAAGAVLVAAAGAVGWRSWTLRQYWYRLTGAYGEPGALPPRHDVTYVYDSMPSRILGRDVDYGVAWPPGRSPLGRGLPIAFVLPGRGRGPREMLEGGLRLGDFAAAPIVARTAPPFAVISVNGGDTYWHKRSSGENAMAMLLEEFIPQCERRFGVGRRGDAVIAGWSMGGYGALRAAELSPGRFRGVCAVSPALWRSFADGVGDAFDGPADYAANDVYAAADRLAGPSPQTRGFAVRIDCGEQDPFYDATRDFVAALPSAAMGGFSPGGHNDGYWRRVAPAEVDFMWRALYSRFDSGRALVGG
jgi:S-formylglutathione hydrolase FrmB